MLYHGDFYYGKDRKHHGMVYYSKIRLLLCTVVPSTMVKTENTMVGLTVVKSDNHAVPWCHLLWYRPKYHGRFNEYLFIRSNKQKTYKYHTENK